MNEIPILTDPTLFPDESVLQHALDGQYQLFDKFMSALTSEPFNLTPEWRFYKDGKSWLCKCLYKKKTQMWVSVWKGYFKASFYFSARYTEGIQDLAITNEIKETFTKAAFVGKIKPLIVKVDNEANLDQVLKIVAYKKSCK